MPTWRCPHCLTVQGESARCFLCGRSATSCGTCTHFRESVVGGVGYCGPDRRRAPLTGAEQRDCWTGAEASAGVGLFAGGTPPMIEYTGTELNVAPVIAARPPGG